MGGKRKSLDKKKPDVSRELKGLDININSLGELQSTFDIDKINEFLDTHVEDKKLRLKDQLSDDDKAESKE